MICLSQKGITFTHALTGAMVHDEIEPREVKGPMSLSAI
jgi:hypothetical protein